jgi:hypothetical protein
MRETRDLLRRRNYLVRQRSAHLQILNGQYNLPPFAKKLSEPANRVDLDIAGRFADVSVQKSVSVDLTLIDALDEQIKDLETYLTRTAKVDDRQAYERLFRFWEDVVPLLGVQALRQKFQRNSARRTFLYQTSPVMARP